MTLPARLIAHAEFLDAKGIHAIPSAIAADLREAAGLLEWRPIEEAPEEGDFLVYMPNELSKVQSARWRRSVKVIGNQFAFDLTKPTHYMPLPKEPRQ